MTNNLRRQLIKAEYERLFSNERSVDAQVVTQLDVQPKVNEFGQQETLEEKFPSVLHYRRNSKKIETRQSMSLDLRSNQENISEIHRTNGNTSTTPVLNPVSKQNNLQVQNDPFQSGNWW